MDDNDTLRVWGVGTFRVFISHTHPHQGKAARLQSALRKLGIASFVAHNDIEPTRLWEDEIINALQSMHVLAALLTPDFNSSDWTEQEVGAAVGRGIPVFPIHMGLLPYGFMKRFQAIPGAVGEPGGASRVAATIADAIRSNPRLESLAIDAYVADAQGSSSYKQTDILASRWSQRWRPSDQQVRSLLAAYNSNNQLSGAGTFDDIILQVMQNHTGAEHQLMPISDRAKRCVPAHEYDNGPSVIPC